MGGATLEHPSAKLDREIFKDGPLRKLDPSNISGHTTVLTSLLRKEGTTTHFILGGGGARSAPLLPPPMQESM